MLRQTHIQAVKEFVSGLFILQKKFKTLKHLKRDAGKVHQHVQREIRTFNRSAQVLHQIFLGFMFHWWILAEKKLMKLKKTKQKIFSDRSKNTTKLQVHTHTHTSECNCGARLEPRFICPSQSQRIKTGTIKSDISSDSVGFTDASFPQINY